MSERESGWYRIKFHHDDDPQIAFYDSDRYCFMIVGCSDEVSGNCADIGKMVMTVSGELVYHNQPTQRALDAVDRYNDPET